MRQLNASNHHQDNQQGSQHTTVNSKDMQLASQIYHRSQLDVYFNPSHPVDQSISQDNNNSSFSFAGIYKSNVGCRRYHNNTQKSATSNTDMLRKSQQSDSVDHHQQQQDQQAVTQQQHKQSLESNDKETYQRFASMCAQIIQAAFRQHLSRKRLLQKRNNKQAFRSLMTGVVQGWRIRKVMRLSRIRRLKEEMIPLIEIRRNIVFAAFNKQQQQQQQHLLHDSSPNPQSMQALLSTNQDYTQIQSTLIPFHKELNILIINLASSGLWVFDDRHYANSTVQHIAGFTVLQSPKDKQGTTKQKQSDRFYKTPGNNRNRMLKQGGGEMLSQQSPWYLQQHSSIDRSSNKGKNNISYSQQYNYNISYDNNSSNNNFYPSNVSENNVHSSSPPLDSISHQHKFNNEYIRQLSKQQQQQQELEQQESQRQQQDGQGDQNVYGQQSNSPPVSARFEGSRLEQHEQKESMEKQVKQEIPLSQGEEDKGNHKEQAKNVEKTMQEEVSACKDNASKKELKEEKVDSQQKRLLEDQQVHQQQMDKGIAKKQHDDKIEGNNGNTRDVEADIELQHQLRQHNNNTGMSSSSVDVVVQNDNGQQQSQVIKSTNKWDDMPVGKGRKIEISEYPSDSQELSEKKDNKKEKQQQKIKKASTSENKEDDKGKEIGQELTSQDKGQENNNYGSVKVDDGSAKKQMKSNEKKDDQEEVEEDSQKKQSKKVTGPKSFLTPKKKPSECSIEGSNIDSSSNSSRYSSSMKIVPQQPLEQQQQLANADQPSNQRKAEKNFLKKGSSHSGGKAVVVVSQKLNWKRVGSKVDCWSTKKIPGENQQEEDDKDGANRKCVSAGKQKKMAQQQSLKSTNKHKNSNDCSQDQQDSQNNQSIGEFSFTKAQQKQQQQQQRSMKMKKGADKGEKQLEKSIGRENNSKKQIISNKSKRSSSSDWLHQPMGEAEITEVLESQPPSALQLPTIDGLQSNMAEMLRLRDALIPFIQTNLMFLDHKDPRIFTKIAKEIIKQASNNNEYSN